MQIPKGLIILSLLAIATWQATRHLPPAWNPWAPLDVRDPPNLLTRYKLSRLANNPTLCEQALATSQLRTAAQLDSPGGATCPLKGVVRVQGGQLRLSSSFLATCPLAVAYALFERHTLAPAAQAMLGAPVVQVDHLGSYACRNIYNRADGRRSQHATANALDIAGFRLGDGRRVSVLADWARQDQVGSFLRQVHDGACDSFNVVLGPAYNAAHRNHFHLDMGGWAVCR